MRKMLLSLAALLLAWGAFAQTRTITGRVLDDTGQPLPQATVLIKGTLNGTSTDLDGRYTIDAANNDVIIFRFVGFVTKEERVGNRTVINVQMELAESDAGEVIIVGYGTQKMEAIAGSVGTLDSKKLEQIPMTSFEQSLQGNVAGLQATGIDGSPGANQQIRIRGIGSISASSEPLYVVDGIPVQSGDITQLNSNGGRSGNVMASFNPNDIESVTVLKDSASTAIYGSRGANGVILITTKSGKTGEARIDLNTLVGFNSVASSKLLQPLNAEQYTQLFIEGYTNRGVSLADAQQNLTNRFQQLTDPVTGRPTDTNWLDAITRTGVTQSYNMSARGGTDKLKYFFSGGYFDQESHIIGSDFERISGRVNLDFKASDNISFTNNLSVGSFDQNGFVDGSAWANPLYNAYLLSPLIPIRDAQGRFNADHKNYFPMGGNNPVGALSGDDSRLTEQMRVTDNFSVNVKFANDFLFRSQWNFDVIQINESQYKNRRYGDGRNSGGYAQVSTLQDRNWVGTQTLQYTKTFGSDHNFDALLGYEAQKSIRKTTYGYGQEFPNDKLRTLASAAAAYSASSTITEYTFASMFSRFNYDFREKYFATASIRRDGSSRFGADNRWGTFYSIGLAWALTEESFLQNSGIINYMKLRTSYGVTGNAGIGNFPSVGLYGYGRDYDGQPGGEPTQIANPALTWESQTNFNIGLDFNLMDKLDGTVEYFSRVSEDLILSVPISMTTGFSSLTQNFGEMKNSGWEFSLNYAAYTSSDLSVNVGFNITKLKNRLTKLNEPYTDGTKRREEGRDYQAYYLFGWAGVDQSNGDPLFYTDETESEVTNDINQAQRYFQDKSATPDFFGGFNIEVAYKKFTLNTQFNYSYGNYIYDANGRFIHGDGRLTPRSTTVWAFENRWVPGKTDAKLPQHVWGDTKGGQAANSTRYLHDASYIRLRNVTLAYDLSSVATMMKIRSLRAYVRGTNLLTITREKDLFLDPEQAINGVAGGLTPAIKTVSIGVDFGF
ncbi:SusC/RagA family TonB-linked outer membrane protein [Roseivirga thermotolerans]|uniref:SusC/RagA family TonB-linked outer membrane protein n=1 Tax=Roseivirga thermotolerans TaxID=1758176 RepID=UPI00273EA8F5|nr:TonB-dependent receptor [Roseivirga thermotolerans]